MAGKFYRGAAFAQLLQQLLRQQYYGGFAPGGEFQSLLASLAESSEPIFEDIMKGYWGELAREGQAVPGEGISGAGYEGFEDLMKEFTASLVSQAIPAYQMPWQTAFGQAAPTATARSGLEAEKMRQQTGAITSGYGSTAQMFGNMCGFAFIEADNGILDRIARRYQEEEGTFEQRIGYKMFCLWIIPLMRKHKIVKNFIKWTMVRPMIWWGRAFYKENQWGHIFYPIAQFWLRNFEAAGKKAISDFRGGFKKFIEEREIIK